MAWWKSRRLQFLAANVFLLFGLLLALRGLFYWGFSEVGNTLEANDGAVLQALGVGVRFDLRLALLMALPLLVMAYLPRFNLVTSVFMRNFARVYLGLSVLVLLLVYIVDFGHYAYLGDRLNVTALRFLEDTAISTQMLWESYPVVWITLGWLATAAAVFVLILLVEKHTLQRDPAQISGLQITSGGVVVVLVLTFGLLGRFSDINFANPVPLRWSDAFVSGNEAVGNLGLNPVLFFYDTSIMESQPFDRKQVEKYYPTVAEFLSLPEADRTPLNFERTISVQPHRLDYERPPNVVFVMLESLGASRVGAYGTPFDPTPHLDRIAEKGWFFEHFYVPVTGTAKTIWAALTGIPDVAAEETASRNPMISHQKLLLNELEGYRKFYFVGGNAGWANLSALLTQSIDGLELYEEGDWQSPNVDVWGISDLNLFRESHQILDQVPDGQPFFAFIQTAGNHRPFTIPDENGDFETRELPADQLADNGFRSAAQYNAVRLLDYNVGEYMKLARQSDYFDNTIFVFFGDHNNRITTIPHMPKFQEVTGLESHHVPHMIYAPRYLQPRRIDEAVSLVDVMPTIAGMLGLEYRNTTLGRDIQRPAPEGERAAFVVLREGPQPVIGAVTQNHLVRMNHDGSNATLHKLYSDNPGSNQAHRYPAQFETLSELARGLFETSRFLFYSNVDKEQAPQAN